MQKSLSLISRLSLLGAGFVIMTSAPLVAQETLQPAPADSFSIVLIPDTQAYKGEGTKGSSQNTNPVTNPIFRAHTDWIAANLQRQNIAFVSHVGDIVDIDEPRQWKVAQACMDVIHGKIPYGISVGNHDMTNAGDSTLFQQYFPQVPIRTVRLVRRLLFRQSERLEILWQQCQQFSVVHRRRDSLDLPAPGMQCPRRRTAMGQRGSGKTC